MYKQSTIYNMKSCVSLRKGLDGDDLILQSENHNALQLPTDVSGELR